MARRSGAVMLSPPAICCSKVSQWQALVRCAGRPPWKRGAVAVSCAITVCVLAVATVASRYNRAAFHPDPFGVAMTADVDAVRTYLLALQDQLCEALAAADGAAQFNEECWQRAEGGGGRSRVLREGALFEQAGVNFSHVRGQALPASATVARPQLAGAAFDACALMIDPAPRPIVLPRCRDPDDQRFLELARDAGAARPPG